MKLPHQKYVFTGIGIFLGLLALIMPVWDVAEPASYIGGLLVWAALLEILHGFRRADSSARASAWISGVITLLIGTLLINAILFQINPLVNAILALFMIDAGRYLYLFFRGRHRGETAWTTLLSGIGNAAVVLLVMYFRGKGFEWVIGVAGSLRIFGTVFSLFTARTGELESVALDVARNMGLKGDLDFENLIQKLQETADRRAPIDRRWIATLIIVLFFIHLGRMGLTGRRWASCPHSSQ